MDKDHLIDLISSSLLCEGKDSDSNKYLSEFKNYINFRSFYFVDNQYLLNFVMLNKSAIYDKS